jgi:hypothetical protein
LRGSGEQGNMNIRDFLFNKPLKSTAVALPKQRRRLSPKEKKGMKLFSSALYSKLDIS